MLPADAASWVARMRTWTISGAAHEKPASITKGGAGPKYRIPSTGTENCGISFQANASSGGSSSQGVYVKVVHNQPETFVLGESHLREVLTATLDRILGTSAVMPAVGRVIPLPLDRPSSKTTAERIAASSLCAADCTTSSLMSVYTLVMPGGSNSVEKT